jgi:putative membrane protein
LQPSKGEYDARKMEVAIMGYGYGRGYGMMDGWFGGGIFMLLFVAVIVIGVFFLVRMLMNKSNTSDRTKENTALEILKQRYARGEISHEEFEKMKANLL